MEYKNGFTESDYLELIGEIKNCGYLIGKFDSNQLNQPLLVIRHDVDLDLISALKMAELEHEHDITSTYFVSMRSPFYNPFSASNTNKINQIHRLGHDVGAHINVELKHGDPLDDINVLQRNFPFLNTKIATIHHPGSMETIKNILNIAVFKSTYAHLFDEKVGYISDSTGKWRNGHPLESDILRMRKSIILLTHPIWWIETGATPYEKITNLFKKYQFENDDIESFLPSFFKDNY